MQKSLECTDCQDSVCSTVCFEGALSPLLIDVVHRQRYTFNVWQSFQCASHQDQVVVLPSGLIQLWRKLWAFLPAHPRHHQQQNTAVVLQRCVSQ